MLPVDIKTSASFSLINGTVFIDISDIFISICHFQKKSTTIKIFDVSVYWLIQFLNLKMNKVYDHEAQRM